MARRCVVSAELMLTFSALSAVLPAGGCPLPSGVYACLDGECPEPMVCVEERCYQPGTEPTGDGDGDGDVPDAGPTDAGLLDAGPVDAGPDAGAADAGPSDGGDDAGPDGGVDPLPASFDVVTVDTGASTVETIRVATHGDQVHAALWLTEPDFTRDAVYATCSGGCEPGDWHLPVIHTATGGGEVRPDIALTAEGAPRMAFTGSNLQIYVAACDDDCGLEASWDKLNLRGGGHPGTAIGPDGAWWVASCSSAGGSLVIDRCESGADCLSLGGWDSEVLAPLCTRVHGLVVDEGGRMSALTSVIGAGTYDLAYASCEASCLDDANWMSTDIANIGSVDDGGDLTWFPGRGRMLVDNDAKQLRRCTGCGPALPPVVYDFSAAELDGAARIAATEAGGARVAADTEGGALTYRICDAACEQAASWSAVEVFSEAGATWDLGLLSSGLPIVLSAGDNSAPGDLRIARGRSSP